MSLAGLVSRCVHAGKNRHLYAMSSDDIQSVNTMCYATAKSSELAVAGSQPSIVLINTNSATTVRKTETTSPAISQIQRSQSLLCCGSVSGVVGFRDPRTLKEEQTIGAHSAGLTQMEAEGNLMITAGYSLKSVVTRSFGC